MEFSDRIEGREPQIIDLFEAVFTASEGSGEGALIGALARDLLRDTPSADIHAFTASDDKALIGAALFTRLTYAKDPRTVFILSPMAVATGWQGKGAGQALLTHALAALGRAGVDVAITYGDPAFYGKAGFSPLTEAAAAPPLPLSHPHGWIGRSLTDAALTPLRGASACVAALNDPAIW